MRIKYLLPVLLLVLGTITLAAGCGVPQADHDTVLTQVAALETEKTALQSELVAIQTEKDTLQADRDALQADKNALETREAALQADYDTLGDGTDSLKVDLASIQSLYDAAREEIAGLNAVHPPREFLSRGELEDWLLTNNVSEKPAGVYAEDWYAHAMEVQADALGDGYIVSVDYDYDAAEDAYFIYCTTVISGTVWYWNPETDVLFEETAFSAIK